jgi:hypothetical protein
VDVDLTIEQRSHARMMPGRSRICEPQQTALAVGGFDPTRDTEPQHDDRFAFWCVGPTS